MWSCQKINLFFSKRITAKCSKPWTMPLLTSKSSIRPSSRLVRAHWPGITSLPLPTPAPSELTITFEAPNQSQSLLLHPTRRSTSSCYSEVAERNSFIETSPLVDVTLSGTELVGRKWITLKIPPKVEEKVTDETVDDNEAKFSWKSVIGGPNRHVPDVVRIQLTLDIQRSRNIFTLGRIPCPSFEFRLASTQASLSKKSQRPWRIQGLDQRTWLIYLHSRTKSNIPSLFHPWVSKRVTIFMKTTRVLFTIVWNACLE